uniref:Uncharacterized protein n=1 Tax=Meloidogyne enterolobii TaxID=390850 RepID=A0A6V7UGK8_MELEN|nr:unnamed protein product [Meloidogyne enterolobii]
MIKIEQIIFLVLIFSMYVVGLYAQIPACCASNTCCTIGTCCPKGVPTCC